MLVGEGPGDVENVQNRPFVGPAGAILRKKLKELGMEGKVYITNVTKCRPPSGVKPKPEHVDACAQHLEKEILAVNPTTIITFGAVATKAFLKKNLKMFEINGQVFDWHTYRVIPIVHPAAQLHYDKVKKRKAKTPGASTEPDDEGEFRKEPIEYFNEAMEKVFGGKVDQARQHALSDFF
jgi:DNA polymerase